MAGIHEVEDLIANKEPGNTAICMKEHGWKEPDTSNKKYFGSIVRLHLAAPFPALG